MLTDEIVLKKIEENKETIKKFGVKEIELLGSSARGEQQKRNDIDILVEFEKGKKTFDNYIDLKFFLEDLFCCNVDLVVKDQLVTKDLLDNILGPIPEIYRFNVILFILLAFTTLLVFMILYFGFIR